MTQTLIGPLNSFPKTIATVAELEEILSRPTLEVIQSIGGLEGDILILGIGGKMGPSLARMAKRAVVAAKTPKRVIGVARFSTPGLQESLEREGIETHTCDLLNRTALESLPDVPNIVFMAGRKFGSEGEIEYTWAMNTFLPGLVAERFHRSRIVAFSTGNVYPFTPAALGGSKETDAPNPIGEYAQSCLGRERIFQYFSLRHGTPCVLIRLNYAVELRYGVLLDIAQKVYSENPISLVMGNANVIWQGDANAQVLRSWAFCESPPRLLNLTGPETLSIRRLAQEFGKKFGKEPIFTDSEADTALLSNASNAMQCFGYPQVPLGQIVDWVAHWVSIGGPTLDKPTHFEERQGRF